MAVFQKSAYWLDWPCPVRAALQNCPQDFLILIYILMFIYFFEYETIVRSRASSFGHSNPDPSSVPTFPLGLARPAFEQEGK